MLIYCRIYIEYDLKMMNNLILIECCSSVDLNLVGKVIIGIVMCMVIFFNGFVFFVVLFSKCFRKSGYNLIIISLFFIDFFIGVFIWLLILYMVNDYIVSYDLCIVVLVGYMICVFVFMFYVFIIGCLWYYVINKNNFIVFKFEFRNVILVIIFIWFFVLLIIFVFFFVFVRKDFLFILCNVNNIFKENYKLYFKIYSMILLCCDFVLIVMYIVVGFKLYVLYWLVRRVYLGFNIDVKLFSVIIRLNIEVCNYNVFNSSLVIIWEMVIFKNDIEVVIDEGDDKFNYFLGRSVCVYYG